MRSFSLIASVLLLGTGLTLAHGELTSADPPPDTIITAIPSEVTLVFSEPVEVRFSTFKVYRLNTEGEATDDKVQTVEHGAEHDETPSSDEASSNPEWLRLNGLAGALVSEVLLLRGDSEARVDTGPQENGQSRTVTLGVTEELVPGVYVVMWRVLSTDTHATQGFYVFKLEAAG